MARLKDFYKENVVSKLTEKFGYKNVMQVPKLVKVVINVGAGEARDNSKVINSILEDLGTITGQKAVVCNNIIVGGISYSFMFGNVCMGKVPNNNKWFSTRAGCKVEF